MSTATQPNALVETITDPSVFTTDDFSLISVTRYMGLSPRQVLNWLLSPKSDGEVTEGEHSVIRVLRALDIGVTDAAHVLSAYHRRGRRHEPDEVDLTPAERAVVATFRASDLDGVRAVRALMLASKEDAEPAARGVNDPPSSAELTLISALRVLRIPTQEALDRLTVPADDVEQEEDVEPDGDPVIGDRLRSLFDAALQHFQLAEELFLVCALKHGEPAGNPDLPLLKQLLFEESEDSLVDAISRLVRIGLIVDGQANHDTDMQGCDWNDFGIVVQTPNGPALVAFKVPLTSDGIRDVALGSAQVSVVDLGEVARLRQGKGIKRGFD